MKNLLSLILLAAAIPGITAIHAGEGGAPFVVTALKGASPASHPIPHIPTHYLEEGDMLYLNSTWLMLPESELQVKHLKTGKTGTIKGPAQFTVREDRIEIYEKPTLEFQDSGN